MWMAGTEGYGIAIGGGRGEAQRGQCDVGEQSAPRGERGQRSLWVQRQSGHQEGRLEQTFVDIKFGLRKIDFLLSHCSQWHERSHPFRVPTL